MNLTWYDTLNKPSITPPSEYFMPIWCIIYGLILISFILFLTKNTSKNKIKGIFVFFIQISLNASWVPTFFVFHNIGLSLIIIILLNIAILLQIFCFYKISRLSAYLLIPYSLWILLATYLNTYIYLFN